MKKRILFFMVTIFCFSVPFQSGAMLIVELCASIYKDLTKYTNLPPLHSAVREGNLVKIKEIIDLSDIDVNSKDRYGNAPIHYVLQSTTKKEVINYLLQKGADINLEGENGDTLLHRLILSGQRDCGEIKFLVENGASLSINKQNKEGISPFHLACKYKNDDIINYLLKCGANVKLVDDKGRNSIHYLCLNHKSNVNSFKVLLSYGATLEETTKYKDIAYFSTACYCKNLEIIKFLIEQGAKITFYSFILACKRRDLNKTMIEYLVNEAEKQGNRNIINQRGYGCRTAIMDVCENTNANFEIIKYFVDQKADLTVESSDGTPFVLAVKNRSLGLETIKMIGKAAPQTILSWDNKNREKGLVDIALGRRRNISIVRYLLSEGCRFRDNILCYIMPNTSLEEVQLLIDNGAQVNGKDVYGNTPLHLARKKEIIELLIKNGADINAKNNIGKAPIAFICKSRDVNFELVKYLVKNGANYGEIPILELLEKKNNDSLFFGVSFGEKREIAKILKYVKYLKQNKAVISRI